ncbi:MAG: hypothetical protein J6Y74_01195 [Clostridia bacterium]|nr:hypothetical protein [Clostridia bacterium]
MLLFGEKIVREGLLEAAKDLFIEDTVMDDVAVMAVAGTAKETLERSVSMQGASSVYLQQLNKINSSTGGHPAATLKTFITHFETEGYTPSLPWVEAIPVPKAVGGADTGGDEQNYVFDCSKTVLFHPDGKGDIEGKALTEALALITSPDGMLLHISAEEEGSLDVNIKKCLRHWKIAEDGSVTFRAVYFVNLVAESVTENLSDLPSDYVEKRAKDHIEKSIETGLTSESGLDPYSLEGKYHKKYGEKKEPQAISLRLDVSVKRSDA